MNGQGNGSQGVDLLALTRMLQNNPALLQQLQQTQATQNQQQEMMNDRKSKNEAKRKKKGLPIYHKREEIMEHVRNNNFTIVVGDTGCGKSTQLPQYLFEEYESNKNARILWVLPRKLPAITLSERVCEEMEIKEGQEIGFEVPNKKNFGNKTVLKFVTDIVLINELIEMRKQVGDGLLQLGYNIIVLDEVHERNLYTDILLASLKDICIETNMKMLVTSATINEKVFEDYFDVKAIHVEGRPYPVEIDYNPMPETNDDISLQIAGFAHIRHMSNCIQRIAKRMEEEEDFAYKGHVLVFTSGVDDINRLMMILQDEISDKFEVLPLHGLLRPDEQKGIFKTVEGKFKIILSTRMAETALTIDGVRVVIDIGFDKESVYDAVKRMTIIENRFIPQSSAKQRTGRAGRTSPGLCIRLYSQEKFELLSRNKVSEIQRMDLGKVVLKLKAMGVDNVVKFDFVEKPAEGLLEKTVDHLMELGAINKHKGDLTLIGDAMLQLDTDPDYSKVILEGLDRGCVHEVIDIIAMTGVNYRLFLRGFDESSKENADKKKLGVVNEKGDLLTLLDLFRAWLMKSRNEQEKWSKENSLRNSAFSDALRTVKDLERSLKIVQAILKSQVPSASKNRYSENYKEVDDIIAVRKSAFLDGGKTEKKEQNILKCFLRAFYPNLAVYTGIPQLGYALLRDDMILKIHGSSVLALLQEYPRYLICLDINKAAYNNTKVATRIEAEWLEQLFPKYEENPNLKFLSKTYNFQKYTIPRLGRQILRYFTDQNNPEIAEIAETAEHSFFVDFKEERLVGYTSTSASASDEEIKVVEEKMHRVLDDIHIQLEQETKEVSMTLHTRAIFKAGGEVAEILLRNEAVSVAFDGFDAAHWDDAALFRAFKKRAKIAKVELNEVDLSTQLRHGVIRFLTPKDAEKVVKYYSGEKELAVFKSEKSQVQPVLNILKGAARSKHQRALRARIEWFTGFSDKSVHLSFLNIERAEIFYEKVRLKKPKLRGGQEVYVTEDYMGLLGSERDDVAILKTVNTRKNLVIQRIRPDLDEIDVDDMIKEYELENNFVRVKVFRTPDNNNALSSDNINAEFYTEIIRNQLVEKVGIDEAEILRIDPYKPRPQKENSGDNAENLRTDYRRWVDVDVYDLSTARKIIDYFDGSTLFSVLTHGRMHCRLNFTKVRTMRQFEYRKIQKEVNQVIEALKEEKGNTIMIRENMENSEDMKGRNKVFVRIMAADPLTLDECCRKLDPILNGVLFHFRTWPQIKRSRDPLMRTKLEQIEAKYDVNCYMRPNKFVKIIGAAVNKELAMKEIEEYFNEVDKKEWQTVVVGFKYRPVRHIFEDDGKALNDIEDKYGIEKTMKNGAEVITRTLKIQASLISKDITIRGKETNINKAVEEVRALVYKFGEKKDLDDNKCPICMAEIIDGFRLQICGHKFCLSCLEAELEERLNHNPEFPFCCSKCQMLAEKKEDIEVKPICLRDLGMIFSLDRQQILWERSMGSYLKKNFDKYFKCYSSGCPQIFRFSEDQQTFSCDYCLKDYCTKCKKHAHGDIECEEARIKIIEDLQKNGVEFRECPGCSQIFIKMEGCDKMHCEGCQTVFCWHCGEQFSTDNDGLKHVQEFHIKNPYDYSQDDFDYD